jgi:hypothetical protein
MGVFRRGIAISAAGMAVVGFSQLPASANAQWANDTWDITSDPTFHVANTTGGVIWGNRTAEVQGTVNRQYNITGYSAVYFDAFQGSTKVDSDFRNTPANSGRTDFHFDIGNPNLPGGIDRIKVQLCSNNLDGTHYACSEPVNLIRN